MTDALWQRSACELADGIRQRIFSCREVMESVVRRIRAKNGALNAIVYDYAEEALVEARQADEDLAAGRVRGPLHGVPVTIKDAQGFTQTKELFDAAIYSFGVNYLGLPAGVVPVGLVDGLPAGVQIVGRRFREDLILDAMAVIEAQVGVMAKTLWARET